MHWHKKNCATERACRHACPLHTTPCEPRAHHHKLAHYPHGNRRQHMQACVSASRTQGGEDGGQAHGHPLDAAVDPVRGGDHQGRDAGRDAQPRCVQAAGTAR